jgi:cytidylate kinase
VVGGMIATRSQPVRIIAVSEDPYSGGEEFARALAAKLGWQCVDSTMLIGRAVARGGDRTQLMAAIKGLRVRKRGLQAQILLLQAALAEFVGNGNVVCYGMAADLLNLEAEEIRRITVAAPYRCRRAAVEEQMNLHGVGARAFVNECDRACRHWRMQLLDSKAGLPLGYDLAINLEEMSLDTALAAAWEMIRERSSLNTFDPVPIENFILLTSIRAGLAIHPATAHLDLDIEILNKSAVLRGTVKDSLEFELVRQVLLSISPESTIDLSQIQLAKTNGRHHRSLRVPSEGGSWRSVSRRIHVAPHLAWTFAGLSALVLAAVAGFWIPQQWPHSANGPLLKIAGVISDSDCGLSHNVEQQTAECVRACVKTRGARYVLSNGFRMFTLADQKKGAALAGERVVTTGYLDDATGYLQLRSVQRVAQ